MQVKNSEQVINMKPSLQPTSFSRLPLCRPPQLLQICQTTRQKVICDAATQPQNISEDLTSLSRRKDGFRALEVLYSRTLWQQTALNIEILLQPVIKLVLLFSVLKSFLWDKFLWGRSNFNSPSYLVLNVPQRRKLAVNMENISICTLSGVILWLFT